MTVSSPLVDIVALTTSVPTSDSIPDQMLSHALSFNDWRKAQRNDPTMQNIIDQLEADSRVLAPQTCTSPSDDRRYFKDSECLFMLHDVLYREVTLNE